MATGYVYEDTIFIWKEIGPSYRSRSNDDPQWKTETPVTWHCSALVTKEGLEGHDTGDVRVESSGESDNVPLAAVMAALARFGVDLTDVQVRRSPDINKDHKQG